MKKFIILIFIICSSLKGYIECRNMDQIILGKTVKIFSKILNEERPLQIHLPPDYMENSSTYPVMIILDGERFFNSTAVMVQFLAQYAHIPPMIVVGIPNVNRNRDFSFEKTELNTEFGATRFLKFLKEEVIPHIEGKYRTSPYRIINGWCATGAFCLYILFTQPSLFNAYLASSPYLVNEVGVIFDLVNECHLNNFKSERFLYLSAGGRDRPDAKRRIPEFIDLLKKKNFHNLEWNYCYFQTEDHYTINFQTLYKALEVLFRDLIQVRKIVADGYGKGRERLVWLATKFGFNKILPEKTLARLGYVLLNQELYKDAICLFRITAEFYPDSYLSFENLGEAYMYKGRNDLAIINLEKSLEIKPDNNYVKDLLVRIKSKIE